MIDHNTYKHIERVAKEYRNSIEAREAEGITPNQARDIRAELQAADQELDIEKRLSRGKYSTSPNIDRAQIATLGNAQHAQAQSKIDHRAIVEASLAKHTKRISHEITREIATEQDLDHALALFTLPQIVDALFLKYGVMGMLNASITTLDTMADSFTLATNDAQDGDTLDRYMEAANRYRVASIGLAVVLENYKVAKGHSTKE